jgi:hypothetical protein
MKPRIPKSKGKTRRVDSSYWLARVILETGWTVDELRKCPIPLYELLVYEIMKKDEDERERFS